MKNLKLKLYVDNHERLEIITETSSFPLPKLSTIMETTNLPSCIHPDTTSMSFFLEKLQREQLYRKHQFHLFRQMALQTTTSTSNSSSSTMFRDDHKIHNENTSSSWYDEDITMNAQRTKSAITDHSTCKNDINADCDDTTTLLLPLTTQMKQRWDVVRLTHRRKIGQQHLSL